MAGNSGLLSIAETFGWSFPILKSNDVTIPSYPTCRPSRNPFFGQGIYTIPTLSFKYAHKPRHIYDPNYNYKKVNSEAWSLAGELL